RRVDARRADDLSNHLDEVGLLELAGRDVDADLQVPQLGPLVVPRARLAAGLVEHPPSDLEDEIRLLSDADELARPDHAPRRMVPANERFEAGRPAGRDLDDGLVVEDELASADGPLARLRERVAGHDGRRHLPLA